jgi:hypothetical protein
MHIHHRFQRKHQCPFASGSCAASISCTERLRGKQDHALASSSDRTSKAHLKNYYSISEYLFFYPTHHSFPRPPRTSHYQGRKRSLCSALKTNRTPHNRNRSHHTHLPNHTRHHRRSHILSLACHCSSSATLIPSQSTTCTYSPCRRRRPAIRIQDRGVDARWSCYTYAGFGRRKTCGG